MINRSPKGYFKSSRELRQGDTLSLKPFVIVAETFNVLMESAKLHRMITKNKKKAKLHGMITGFSTGSSIHEVTSLQFVGDTIIFCDALVENVDML